MIDASTLAEMFWASVMAVVLQATFFIGKEWGRHIENKSGSQTGNQELFFLNQGGGYVRFSPGMATTEKLEMLQRAIACIDDAPSVKEQFEDCKDQPREDCNGN